MRRGTEWGERREPCRRAVTKWSVIGLRVVTGATVGDRVTGRRAFDEAVGAEQSKDDDVA